MTQNPFDALGGGEAGGFDLEGLLQQAQQMQSQLESAQQRLAEARVDGTVAGGAVTVTLNGIGVYGKATFKGAGTYQLSGATALAWDGTVDLGRPNGKHG